MTATQRDQTLDSRSYWPIAAAGEALEALAQHARLSPVAVPIAAFEAPNTVNATDGADTLGDWLLRLGRAMSLELESVNAPAAQVASMLVRAAPALVRIRTSDEVGLVAVCGGGGAWLRVIGRDHIVRRVSAQSVADAAGAGDLATPEAAASLDRCLESSGIHGERRTRARRAMADAMADGAPELGIWLVRPALTRNGWRGFVTLLRSERVSGPAVLFLLAQLAHALAWVGSWWLLGRGALDGKLEPSLLFAWVMLLMSLIPLHVIATASAGRVALRGGALLQRRLFLGATCLDGERVRQDGAGRWLGRVLESQVLEESVLSGACLCVAAIMNLTLAGWVLSMSLGGLAPMALVAWLTFAICIARVYFARRRTWVEARLELTGRLVESMVGHRTRFAQEPRRRRHRGEDLELERYHGAAASYDRVSLVVSGVLERGWLLVGTLSLAPAIVSNGASAGVLAAGVGGVLLAGRAFRELADGVEKLAAAAAAWRSARACMVEVGIGEQLGQPRWAATENDAATSTNATSLPLLEAHDVSFSHPGRERQVLREVALSVHSGERVLMEGPSGGGKSTLASVLCASRAPNAGLLLLNGLDRATLGDDAWRQQAALAPQFAENHIFMGTLAFNLLMGRDWPPRPADIADATEVCHGLGLDPLLARMPSGLAQLVGETGWQLSHGERSRVFMARALLQRSELLVLDESFAALDPATLKQTLTYVMERAPTLMVVAHP